VPDLASSADLNGIPQRQLDRLYAAPLDEFVAVRKEVSVDLADDGHGEEAEAVRALRKPSLPAWAVNQLAREEKPALKRLLDATAAVRRAQGEGRGDYAGARRDLDEAAAELVGAARTVIDRSGKKPTEAMLRRVEQTLRGAATSQPDELRRGVLAEEVEPAGFEALLGVAPARPSSRRPSPRARPSELEAARRRLSAARAKAEKLTREARDADRAASTARAAWDRARERAERAAAGLEEAERAVAEADQSLRALRGQSARSPSRAAGG
jgi:hypothetical protein